MIKPTRELGMNGKSKPVCDMGAIVLMLGAFADWLPSVAAFLSVVWMGIRIYETDTVQSILDKVFEHRKKDKRG